MFFIHYVLVIATCTQHLLVLGSVSAGNSGKNLATENDKTFSLEAAAAVMRKIHHDGADFSIKHRFLKKLSKGEMDFESSFIFDSVIKDGGELPRINVETEHNSSGRFKRILNQIGGHSSAIKANAISTKDTKELQKTKIKILKDFQSNKMPNSLDQVILREWAIDSLNEARSVVQSHLLNGKPDEGTVKLFKEPTNPESVINFLNGMSIREVSYYILDPLCMKLSEKLFQDRGYLLPKIDKLTAKQYKCQIGNNEELKKELIELGSCADTRNRERSFTSKVSYFKIAVAKLQKIENKPAAVEIEYFICFDKIKKHGASWQYDYYVAKSFLLIIDPTL